MTIKLDFSETKSQNELEIGSFLVTTLKKTPEI